MSTFGNQSGIDLSPDDKPMETNPETNQGQPSPNDSALKQSDTQSQDDGSTPNVVLSKDREHEAVPEGLTNIGTVGIVLPSIEIQMTGFYLPQDEASRLVSQFRQYKFLVNKGQATPAVRIGE
ncbi:MAG: hypothetical protein ABJA67_12835 [Chthonomonadales bacterium]